MSGRARHTPVHGRRPGRGSGRSPGRAPGQSFGRRPGPIRTRTALVLTLTTALLAPALLTACGPFGTTASGRSGGPAAHARHPSGPAPRPVPRGSGSEAPYDFNGDGHPDLVVDDLLAPGGRAAHDDDPGIGIVYGSARGLVPGSRRLLTPSRNAAPTKGVVPAAFEAGPACDLDGDGFTDLVVTADPPYDGVGRPPVPVQIGRVV